MSNIFVVSNSFAGVRVDNFISNRLKRTIAKPYLHKIIRTGQVRVNGSRVKSASRLNASDKVRIPPFLIEQSAVRAKYMPPAKKMEDLASMLLEKIIYEDKGILVINKPSGVAVHGGSGLSYGVIEALRSTNKFYELELVHRLDKDTSGCLILAKKRSSLRRLHEYLRDGDMITKRYSALCHSSLSKSKFMVDKPLLKIHDISGQWKVIISEEGKDSQTRFKCLKRMPSARMFEAELITGRTHQIRVHLASENSHIIGDSRYGCKKINDQYANIIGTERLFLHASSIFIKNYEDGKDLLVEAKLPELFEIAANKLSDVQV